MARFYTRGGETSESSEVSLRMSYLCSHHSLFSPLVHLANHLSEGLPPVSLTRLEYARPVFASRVRAWPMRCAAWCLLNRWDISVLLIPAEPAVLRASRIWSATASPVASPKM